MKGFFKKVLCVFALMATGIDGAINSGNSVFSSNCSVCTCRVDHYPSYPELTDKLNIVDCSGLGLKEIPNEILQKHDVQVLLLNNNKIDFKSNKKLQFDKLLVLEVENNDITYIPPNIFSSLKNLKILNLLSYESFITFANNSVLDGLSSLQTLKLSISNMPGNQFINSSVNNLKNLTLVVDNDNLPDSLLNGLNLLELNLFADKITAIPSTLLRAMIKNENKASLQILSLTARSLKTLPEKFLTDFLLSLHSFTFTTNQMSSLPYAIFKLPKEDEGSGAADSFLTIGPSLMEIKISGVQSFKSAFFSDLDLESLHLQGVQEMSTDTFHGLSGVKELMITDCNMSYIDNEQFSTLYYLNKLKISSCKLISLQKYLLRSNSRLEHLDLSHNNIREIEQDAFFTLSFSLITLDLSYNEINALNQDAIDCHRLKKLDLSYNEIDTIHPHAFRSLDVLEELRLTSNQVKMLPIDVFDSLFNVRKIDLQSNHLYEFQERILSLTYMLEELNLSYNNITKIDLSGYPEVSVFLTGNPVKTATDLKQDTSTEDHNENQDTDIKVDFDKLFKAKNDIASLLSTLKPKFEQELEDDFILTNVGKSASDKPSEKIHPQIHIDGLHYKVSDGNADWVAPVVGTFCGIIILAALVSFIVVLRKKRQQTYSVVQEMSHMQDVEDEINPEV